MTKSSFTSGGTESSSGYIKKEDATIQSCLVLILRPMNKKEHFRAIKRNYTSRRVFPNLTKKKKEKKSNQKTRRKHIDMKEIHNVF